MFHPHRRMVNGMGLLVNGTDLVICLASVFSGRWYEYHGKWYKVCAYW